jgi:hypothetical protein
MYQYKCFWGLTSENGTGYKLQNIEGENEEVL